MAREFSRLAPRPIVQRIKMAGTSPAMARKAAAGEALVTVLVELADVMLGIELKAELGDEIELGFEEVDVVFFVLHQRLKQIARDVVLDHMAVGGGFLVQRTR